MSTELAMQFGSEYHEDYAKVLDRWSNKVTRVAGTSPRLESQWGLDLQEALGEPVHAALLHADALGQWKKVKLPSKDALDMFAKIAVKYSLAFATSDLLRRLIRSVKDEKKDNGVQAAAFSPSELANRARQTVAQIFDMARDAFNAVLNRFLHRREELTGRRRWVSTGDNSRHADLHHEIRDEGEPFLYKKELIQGPRPPGGNPHDWSNCSCVIELERRDGTWFTP